MRNVLIALKERNEARRLAAVAGALSAPGDKIDVVSVVESRTPNTPSTAPASRTARSAAALVSSSPRSVTRPSATETSMISGSTPRVYSSTVLLTPCRIDSSLRR
jgi:hypothetical protein